MRNEPRKKAGRKAERTEGKRVKAAPSVSKSEEPESPPPKKNRGHFVPNDPRTNRTKPGPGRPTNKFKNWCRKQVMSATSRRSIRKILRNSRHPAFKAMWSELAAHGHGRPEQKSTIDAKVTLLEDLVGKSQEHDER